MILRPVRDDEEDAETVRQIAAAALGARQSLKPGAAEAGAPGDGTAPAGGTAEPGTATGGGTAEPGRDGAAAARDRSRTRHAARTDPGGCWIAEHDGPGGSGPLGAVLSTRREGTWALGLLAVAPGAQGKGVGKALLARAMVHGKACLRGIVIGSPHPVAARLYRRAGFTLHPAMRLTGSVDPTGLAPPDGAVHPGNARNRDMMDSVDRRTRGGAHGPDHEELLRHHRLFVADDLAGSGYCYAGDEGVELLAATSRRLATRLLTAALLSVPPGTPVQVTGLTAEQEWALDVGIAAGLEIRNAGYVCLRGMRPPAPYVPSTAFL